MRWTTGPVLAALLLGGACSDGEGRCGEGGRRIGAVCAYAVVEGGFDCPADLPVDFELPGGGRICAPADSTPDDLPIEACRELGRPDCSEARPAGMSDASMPDPDAGPGTDAGLPEDAGVPAMCDMLEASGWTGASPAGPLDVEVDAFISGDCITISGATLTLRGAGGEELTLSFSYPVTAGAEGRSVSGTFMRMATARATPAGGSAMETTAMIEVAVTSWVEHPGPEGHEIDATVRILDARFGVDPIVVRGRFCEWAALLC